VKVSLAVIQTLEEQPLKEQKQETQLNQDDSQEDTAAVSENGSSWSMKTPELQIMKCKTC
jgi:hypothetical protein